MKAATYLYFKGQAKEVIEAYQTLFRAEVVCEYFYTEEMTQNPELYGKVFHAELKIGGLNLYLADWDKDSAFPSTKFVLEFPNEDEARACLEKITRTGKLVHDFCTVPGGPTYAGAEDPFGIEWNIVIG
jgi:uncharacterized glyoxalase superfamily protein PhnB